MNYSKSYFQPETVEDDLPELRTLVAGESSIGEVARPTVKGKFIFIGEQKFYIRGVTYGPFRPDDAGCEYHSPEIVERDFAEMARNGVNSIRTYTPPPMWLLDVAYRHGLRVMLGISWEQHLTFLDYDHVPGSIEAHVRQTVRTYAAHPAI